MNLTNDENERYQRHLILPEIGEVGQLKLKNAKVLLVGAGGLGSPLAIYLSAVGVGTIGVVDFDHVDVSNLQRQVIHDTDDVGRPKVQSAKEKMTRINPGIEVVAHETAIHAGNAFGIIEPYDIVIDGSDNFPTRYLVNDACVLSGKPTVYGAIYRFEGQCSVFGMYGGPCYRCLFPEPPSGNEIPSCAEAGVLGVLPGMIGLLQANEAIKLICDIGVSLSGRLLILDALNTRFRELAIAKDPQCPICGEHRTIFTLTDYEQGCADQHDPTGATAITAVDVRRMMEQDPNAFLLIDVREPAEWKSSHIDGAILKPLSTFEEACHGIPRDRPVVLYCQMGARSEKALRLLMARGYDNCMHMAGGIATWQRSAAGNRA